MATYPPTHTYLQLTLGFETLDKAAALGLETGFSNLKIRLLYSKIVAVVVSKPSGNKNKCAVYMVSVPGFYTHTLALEAALDLETSTPLTEGGF